MTKPDFGAWRQGQEFYGHAARGMSGPPAKERPWLRRGTANERMHHDRRLGL